MNAPRAGTQACIDLRERLTIVVLTYRRAPRVMQTVDRLLRLPERCAIVAVDNASPDDTVSRLRGSFPAVTVLRMDRNVGASARNAGAQLASTPYVAFCDDDTWWSPGSLRHAVDVLDRHPKVALLSANVLVGARMLEDSTCRLMAQSPLPGTGLPGTRLLGFMAGACVVRRDAFLQAGGYQSAFFLGGEEDLLALDLAAAGWDLCYVPELVVHHDPMPHADSGSRAALARRNAVWTAWLRRPLRVALAQTLEALRSARREGALLRSARELVVAAPWLLRHRRRLPAHVEAMRRRLDEQLRQAGC